jgi:hypothetical protein
MNNVNIGNAGEYFVAGELERRGFTVGVPMSNVKDYDILCINKNGKQFALQVKTTSYGRNKWILSKKNETISNEDVFYVFVHLHQLESPTYHIVPSKYVAETISKGHADWLKQPSKTGKAHKDSDIRTIEFEEDSPYLNNWGYLENK